MLITLFNSKGQIYLLVSNFYSQALVNVECKSQDDVNVNKLDNVNEKVWLRKLEEGRTDSNTNAHILQSGYSRETDRS